ncbi:DUF6161 domain-containing protein [Epibacterium sp. MM17-32]|uniref:DUF6161 domain-containing protein n=1 Tax=Epibacterium sp. MM17-32 TaxID=2917734 RepID=UPI001EF45C17|nr:DUF6161 domain-containing protein [Epibacterium sp. MM17-32]MCG7630388.1 DUF6161 domain-containing protein [Epibacterium sp. MM17-32]
MIEISEITDQDSLMKWLDGQPQEVIVAVALRMALRVFPIFLRQAIETDQSRGEQLALAGIRALLLSSVAHETANARLRTKAADLARRHSVAKRSKVETAVFASVFVVGNVNAMRTSIGAALAAFREFGKSNKYVDAGLADEIAIDNMRNDCLAVSQNEDVWQLPLWVDENPIGRDIVRLFARLHNAVGDWSFWMEWYEQMLDPVTNPPDWDLLEQVALIEPEVWDAGPEAVGVAIERIKQGRVKNARSRSTNMDVIDERQHVLQSTMDSLQDEVSSLEERLPLLSKENEALHERYSALSNEIDAQKKHFQSSFDALSADYQDKFSTALASFVEDQKIKAPVELWQEKEKEHTERRDKAWTGYLRALFLVAGLIVAIISVLCFGNEILERVLTPVGCDPINKPELCNGFSFRGMIVSGSVLTLLTLALWFARIQMKEYLSERHLALDARERRAFAQAYIGLINEGDSVTDEARDQRALVYAALFRPSSDGIIKEDSGIDPSLTAALSKLLSK